MAAVLIVIISSSSSGPPPSTVIGFFMLLQHNRFLGLVDLGLFDIAAVALLVPMFLAVCIALRRASASFMAIALTLSLVGIAVYLATETAFSMLSLSSQYAAATTDAQRSLFEAAGQAMLAEQVGAGTGTYMAFVLIGVAGLIIATVMLRSDSLQQSHCCCGNPGKRNPVCLLHRISFRAHPFSDRCSSSTGPPACFP